MSPENNDEMRPEYDIRGGVRGKYLERYRRWTSITAGSIESSIDVIGMTSAGTQSSAKITTEVSYQVPHVSRQIQFGGSPAEPHVPAGSA